MSDRLTNLFEEVRTQHPPAPFAPAEHVRRRARQRSRRRAAAAALALLVATGGGTVAIARLSPDRGVPDVIASTPPTDAPSTGAPTDPPDTISPAPVAASAMLTAGDFGPGWRTEEADDQGPDGPEWPWNPYECPTFEPAAHPWAAARGPARILTYYRIGFDVSAEVVSRYPAGAADVVRQIGAAMDACASYRVTGRQPYDDRSGMDYVLERVDTGPVGDESLIVRQTTTYLEGRPLVPHDRPNLAYHVVVRRGDLLAWARLEPDDEALARRIAVRMAERLG
jgi:hypothetical protein